MASIGSTFTGSSASATSENVTNPTIINLDMTTANTEYNYAFPSNCRRFWIQNRNNGTLELRHVSASTEYVTIFPGQVYSADFLNVGSTIYLKSSKAAQVAEIEYWIKI